MYFSVIGNLGMDAVIKHANGRDFVSFDVAQTDVYTDEKGNRKESITWVSCALSGDGGNLLPYLKKGRKVYVAGNGSVRVYSSKVQRAMCAGVNISVKQIELLGGEPDPVPRNLVAPTGELLQTARAYYIDPEKAKAYGANKENDILLNGERGGLFRVSRLGYITPEPANDSTQPEPTQA